MLICLHFLLFKNGSVDLAIFSSKKDICRMRRKQMNAEGEGKAAYMIYCYNVCSFVFPESRFIST
jgi:hypothetical protein